jgi:tetratricopeptide (TPR) repeat protein
LFKLLEYAGRVGQSWSVTATPLGGEAAEAMRLAEIDPTRALDLARRTARLARRAGDFPAASVAERARGLALRHCGDLHSAIGHLRLAVRLGERAGSPQLSGQARMTLGYALYERGRPRQGLAEIDAALSGLDGLAAAAARAQRGTILGELGRHEEAFENYRDALPAFRAAGDLGWICRVVTNRGLAHAYRHEFAAAEADLREAERLTRQLDLGVLVGFAQANLGYVLGRRGDVPAALGYMDLAEECIRRQHAQVGALLEDRAELLLSVQVVAEAREAAAQAVQAFRQEKRQVKLPEMRLLLARAAFLSGDPAESLRQAARAVREFTRQDRPNWAALARLVALRARYEGRLGGRVEVRTAETVVRELAASGQQGALLEARLLTARLMLDRGRTGEAAAHLARAGRGRRAGPAASRARGWYAEALLRYHSGNARGATAAVRAGLRVLDTHQAVLGATDLRALAAGNRTELAELGLRIAVEGGRPRRILEWADRGRASHLHRQPLRPPEDAKLGDALAQLRATVVGLNELPETAASRTALRRRQVGLERQIRDHLRRLPGAGPWQPPDPVAAERLVAALGPRGLVEFVQLDGRLGAVTVAGGRVRQRWLGTVAEVIDLVARVPFALRRLIRPAGAPSAAAAAMLLRNVGARLDELLLRGCPELAGRPLVVVPTGPLQNLAWSVLPSCADRPVTVAPSASLWHAASARGCPPAGHVVVAAGPGLPAAAAEARAVGAIHGADPLLDGQAGVAAVLAALDGAALVHLAAHGALSAHNQLFTRLRFADGPLLVYDLEQLASAPHTVVLAACDGARSVVGGGDELLGLTSTFISQGTAQLIASLLPVPDAETAPVMTAFHRLLAEGRPPAVALAAVQQHAAGTLVTRAVAASFICLGAGFSPVPLAGRPAASLASG